jgi:hypothetical protein
VITGAGTSAGRPLLFLGLDAENVARLKAGEPIKIPASRLGLLGLPPVVVVIHYRDTMEELAEDAAQIAATEAGR